MDESRAIGLRMSHTNWYKMFIRRFLVRRLKSRRSVETSRTTENTYNGTIQDPLHIRVGINFSTVSIGLRPAGPTALPVQSKSFGHGQPLINVSANLLDWLRVCAPNTQPAAVVVGSQVTHVPRRSVTTKLAPPLPGKFDGCVPTSRAACGG